MILLRHPRSATGKCLDFRMACTYAASQGWLIVTDDTLTLTTAGLAAA